MERRKRLQEIQEKLRQQAAELKVQREKEMMDTLEQLKNSALKSLLDGLFFLIYTTQIVQHGYLSGATCRLAYGPAEATATHCLLLQ